MADSAALIDRLRTHKFLEGLPESELEWLAERGALRTLGRNEVLAPHEAESTEGFALVLSGVIEMYVARGGEKRKASAWPAGQVTGLLPYSRMKTPPGDTVSAENTEVFFIHRDLFPDLIRDCHQTTSRLVHLMIDRAREFTLTDLHDEKLAALGRMAAGLAHELNNPAAVVASGARSLIQRFKEVGEAASAFSSAGLDADQLAAVDRLIHMCSEPATTVRSPLAQADFLEEISDWLNEHGANIDHAEALAETDMTLETLDELAKTIQGKQLDAALCWTAAVSSGRGLAVEVEQAAAGIHALVRAVQGFTSMDRALVAEPMEVGQGLYTTMLVLKSKAREKSVGMSLDLEPGLPKVNGLAGELNQVWINLIVNAIDAAGENGKVKVRATRDSESVIVRVIDTGPGIPEETRQNIFEPFFTTKKVGDGMGLGLDIVRRLVLRNDGEIEIDSKPGHTEFRVRLPALKT